MTTLQGFWQKLRRQGQDETAEPTAVPTPIAPLPELTPLDLDIASNDPLLATAQQSKGVLDLDRLRLDSPALDVLRAAGVRLVVPLVSQGELIGLINLGQRRSEQEYSGDDHKLMGDLATQAAPALRIAQLVQQQKQQAAERERMEQELKVARLIQQTLLPQSVPALAGWHVSAYYRPARAVGGDFYDFIYFPDGKVGFIVADVTDKGVPAALVMATTRTLLRAAAERLEAPGDVLARTNDVLVQEIPPKMFVTCFYGLLDPASGHLRYANAGHDVPYRYTTEGVLELRATGMPLGLMPGMNYEEKETTLAAGDYVLLYSDGLVEAHNGERKMFGFPRLQELLGTHAEGTTVNDFLLAQLADFTGPTWEQEDDVTLVTIVNSKQSTVNSEQSTEAGSQTRKLAAFTLPSAPNNERQAMAQVAEAVAGLPLSERQIERLKTAVAEATMNAMEHGNQYDSDKPVEIEVTASETATSAPDGGRPRSVQAVRVTITDQGGGPPPEAANTPDLEAKLVGEQSPRGWGLFLIKNMVDEMNVHQEEGQHVVELIVYLTEQEA
jgi:serine phosphatase RsbU (regulator of sigma subunit)/anti-sigma regulatory factor (Ser/Thr protein kinase)